MASPQTLAATASRSATSEKAQAVTNATSFSRSTAFGINNAYPAITMTSAVASRNEVASFSCSRCGDEWLSRPSTVMDSGCGSCASSDQAAAIPPRWGKEEEELLRLLSTG